MSRLGPEKQVPSISKFKFYSQILSKDRMILGRLSVFTLARSAAKSAEVTTTYQSDIQCLQLPYNKCEVALCVRESVFVCVLSTCQFSALTNAVNSLLTCRQESRTGHVVSHLRATVLIPTVIILMQSESQILKANKYSSLFLRYLPFFV